ncbi:MAG: tetratricopeptide repeat protein [bacterium]|nr:tetratricopeptide repeat protein [bacterium]
MGLFLGKHKLVILAIIVLVCVGVSLIFIRSSKPKSTKPPVQMQVDQPDVPGSTAPSQTEPDVKGGSPGGGGSPSTSTPTVQPPITSKTQATVASYYQNAMDSKNQGQFNDALQSLDSAIKLDSSQVTLYLEKAEIQFKLDLKDEAVKTLEEGLRVLPENELLSNQLFVYKTSQ